MQGHVSLLAGTFTDSILQSIYKEKGAVPEEEVQIHRIRITLTSRNVKSLEKGW